MQFTELDDEDPYTNLRTKLDMLRHIPFDVCPDEPSEDIVPLAQSFQQLKSEYLQTVNTLFDKYIHLQRITEKIEKLKEVTRTFETHHKYIEELEQLVDTFEADEDIPTLKIEIQELSRRFFMLKRVLNFSDLEEKYICFTCLENHIDTFLEPCGHVICTMCAGRVRRTCPYCRTDVTARRMYLG